MGYACLLVEVGAFAVRSEDRDQVHGPVAGTRAAIDKDSRHDSRPLPEHANGVIAASIADRGHLRGRLPSVSVAEP